MNTEHNGASRVRFITTIHLHGLTLAVLSADGIDYVPAKPLCELAGLDWKSAKRTLQSGDNVVLFGTKRLNPPHIEGLGGLKPPRMDDPVSSVLCLRLDRSRMYLAKISTDRMRANGNHAAADQLLAVQVEWAEVLHRYETHGIAVKVGRRNTLRELTQCARAIEQLRDARMRHALATALHDELGVLGLPADTFDDDQLALPLAAQA